MAEDKKGFILYADLIYTFKHLPMKERGMIITWVLEYVNDLDPEPLEGLLAAVCEPIRLQLKRDLEKYQKVKEGYSKAGKASAEARRLKKLKDVEHNPTTLNDVKNVATIPTVSDTVSVNVSDINKEIDFKMPTKDIFMVYVKGKMEEKGDNEKYQRVGRSYMISTYDAWKLNNWKDGNDKKIKNWKTKALMQLRYIK